MKGFIMLSFKYIFEAQADRPISQLEEATFGLNKKDNPIIDLDTYSKEDEVLACADWDMIDHSYILKLEYRDSAFIFRSPSGKVKALFKFKAPRGTDRARLLKEYLPVQLHDFDPAGLSLVFISEDTSYDICEGISELKALDSSFIGC